MRFDAHRVLMKKIICLSRFLVILFFPILFSCQQEDKSILSKNNESEIVYQRSNEIINEYNVGDYHNQMISYVFDDLNKLSHSEIKDRISTSGGLINLK